MSFYDVKRKRESQPRALRMMTVAIKLMHGFLVDTGCLRGNVRQVLGLVKSVDGVLLKMTPRISYLCKYNLVIRVIHI